MKSLSADVESAAAPFAALADGVLKADAALAAMAAGGIALAISAASKFQDSFNEIISISAISGNSVGKFRDDIISYSQNSTASIENINKSVYDAISAGVKYSDSLDLIKTSEKLSVAGRADLDATTMLLVSTMNAYGASTDQAGKFSDVFFQTVKLGQTTVPELAQSLANVSGIASSAGVPIETLGAAIAALTASGIKTPEAMTGIKAALENIIKPSETCQKAAAALGIQFDAGALQSKGFEGVLKDVITATGGNIEKMSGLFGSVEALNAALILGKDKSGVFAGALDAMKNSAGSTDAAYKIMADNMSLATQNLKNNVEVVLIDIGEKILPKFGGDVNALAQVFKSAKFALDSGAFDPVFAILDDAGAAIGRALTAIAKNFPEAMKQVKFDDLVRALKDLGGSFGTLFDNIDIDTPEGLAKAIQGVVDTITSLIDITTGMVDAFKPMWDSLTSAVGGFNDLDSSAKKSGGEILATAKLVVDAGIAIAGAVVVIAATGADLKGAFEIIIGSVGLIWDSAKVTIDAIIVTVTSAIDGMISVVNALSFGVFKSELSGVSDKLNSFKGTWENAFIQNANEVRDDLGLVGQGFVELGSGADEATGKIDKTSTAIRLVPDQKNSRIELSYEDALKAVQSVTTGLDGLPLKRDIAIVASTDQPSIESAKKAYSWTTDERGVTVITIADHAKIAETKKTIEDNIPAEKKLTIQAEIQKEQIKAKTDEIKAYFDFKAKVDVAELESAAKIMESAFGSINAVMAATSTTIGALAPLLDPHNINWTEIYQLIQDQIALQKQAVDSQSSLIEAQVKYLESKAKAVDRGDAMITITGDGLAPELEAFMFKVLERIQVRVAEEHAEFLLGVA
jgi:TP901 family phage tail tape measure protein